MILGVGIDLLDIKRVEKLYLTHPERFVKRILSYKEMKDFENSKNKTNFLAKKFCAKEAFSKAIGTGIGRGINFTDIAIKNDILGKPIIELSSSGCETIEKLFNLNFKNIKFNISITDESHYINSIVIASSI